MKESMQWHECTMKAAIQHAAGRKVSDQQWVWEERRSPDSECEVVIFTDETAVACLSTMEWENYCDDEYAVMKHPKWWIFQ
jgi:hypothetical protein